MAKTTTNLLKKKIDDLTINGTTKFDRVSEEHNTAMDNYKSVVKEIFGIQDKDIPLSLLAEYERKILAKKSPYKEHKLYGQFLELREKKQQAYKNLDYNHEETTFVEFALLNEPHPFIESVKKLTEKVGCMTGRSANEIWENLTTSSAAYHHLLYYKELLKSQARVSKEAAEVLLIVPELEELLEPKPDLSNQKLLPLEGAMPDEDTTPSAYVNQDPEE